MALQGSISKCKQNSENLGFTVFHHIPSVQPPMEKQRLLQENGQRLFQAHLSIDITITEKSQIPERQEQSNKILHPIPSFLPKVRRNNKKYRF